MDILLWHFLTFNVLGVFSLQREYHLTQATWQDCQTLQLGDLWSAASVVACFAECRARFPESCQSVVYNENTKNCRFGSPAFGPILTISTSIPEADSTDAIFYAKQPVPPCDPVDDFTIHNVCGTSACIYISTEIADYTGAKAHCTAINSNLYVGNSRAKYALFWYTNQNYVNASVLIGLTDLDVENTFKWANGDVLSEEEAQYIWANNQPDDYNGNEDCVEARDPIFTHVEALIDVPCKQVKHYICEQ